MESRRDGRSRRVHPRIHRGRNNHATCALLDHEMKKFSDLQLSSLPFAARVDMRDSPQRLASAGAMMRMRSLVVMASLCLGLPACSARNSPTTFGTTGIVIDVPVCRHAQVSRTTVTIWDCAGAPTPQPTPPPVQPTPQPTPPPTPKPTAPAPSPSAAPPSCNAGTLNTDLGGGNMGFTDHMLYAGYSVAYCATLPAGGVKTVSFRMSGKCQGATIRMRLWPPAGAKYGDGTPVPVIEQVSGTIALGSSRYAAGWVPGGVYVMENF